MGISVFTLSSPSVKKAMYSCATELFCNSSLIGDTMILRYGRSRGIMNPDKDKRESEEADELATSSGPPPVAGWKPGAQSAAPARLERSAKRLGNGRAFFWPVVGVALVGIVFVGWWSFWPSKSDKVAVTIASVPPQAMVFINDEPAKKGANAKYELAPGQYNVRLVLADFESFEGTIEVADNRLFHKFTLTKIGAKTSPVVSKRSIRLVSSPPGADVYINDKLQDKKTNADFDVPDGPVVVKLVHQGVPPAIKKFDDPSQMSKVVEVVFDRQVRLLSDPPGATISLDGKRLGKAPLTLPLKPGTYKAKAELAGHAAEEKTLLVADAQLFQEDNLTLRALPVEKYALLVGVQSVKDLPSFVHAESDVEALGQTLHAGGFKSDKVAVLTQSRGQAKPDELPSAAVLKQRLRAVATGTTSSDVLVVILVGHAIEPPDAAQTYFCPDGTNLMAPDTLVALDDVLDILKHAPAQKKLLILDCWRRDPKNKQKYLRFWDREPPPGVTILYACAKGESGYEHPTFWHGAFNYFLMQGLLGAGAPGANAQQAVSGPELGNYCERQLAKLMSDTFNSARQVPLLSAPAGSQAWPITTPSAATVDFLHGCALLDQKGKEFGKAIAAFNRAEAQLAGFSELFLRRAEAHYDNKNYQAAIADCQTVLKQSPNCAAALANLAESQAANNDYITAVKNATKATELDLQCALAFDARGSVFHSKQDFDEAISDIGKAIALQPDLYVLYHHRGFVHKSRKDWDEADADFSKAIELNKAKAYLYADRGEVREQQKLVEPALADYSAALERDAGNYRWWLKRGKLRYARGDLDNAIVDIKKATDLQKDSKVAWFNLGFVYNEKKMYAQAAAALRQALQLDANYTAARRLLREVEDKLPAETKRK
jgi:tetratricopeptide (TPR) repeat protein